MLEALHKFFEWVEGECGPHEVIVKRGDTLSSIAHQGTGNATRWKELAEANPGRDWDEKYTIHSGDKITLPASWGPPHGAHHQAGRAGPPSVRNQDRDEDDGA